MKNPPTVIGIGETIEQELEGLRQHVGHYREALNDEGIWLFLATLGCWGVTFGPLRLVAFGIAVALFGNRMAGRISEKRSFSNLIAAIENRVEKILPEGDTRKARLYDLAHYRRNELSTLNSFRNTSPFLMSWAFFVVSFAWASFTVGK